MYGEPTLLFDDLALVELRRAAMDLLREEGNPEHFVLNFNWDLHNPDSWLYPTCDDLVHFWVIHFDLDLDFVRGQKRFFLILFKLFVNGFYCEMRARSRNLEYQAFSLRFNTDVMFTVGSMIELSRLFAKTGKCSVVRARMQQAKDRVVLLCSVEKGRLHGYGKVPYKVPEPTGRLTRLSRAHSTLLSRAPHLNRRNPVEYISTPISRKLHSMKKGSQCREKKLLLRRWQHRMNRDLKSQPEAFQERDLRHACRLLGKPLMKHVNRTKEPLVEILEHINSLEM